MKGIDIKTTFLQGENFKQKVYIKPLETNKHHSGISKLKQSVYSLIEASQMWFKRVKKFVMDNGGKSVTDLKKTKKKKQKKLVIRNCMKHFLSEKKEDKFRYLGLNIIS